MKYTLKKGQNQEDVLKINGLDSVCPFVGAIAMEGNMGGLQLLRMPCTTQCPHASVQFQEKSGEVFYNITCGNSYQSFAIQKEEEEKPKPTILKMS